MTKRAAVLLNAVLMCLIAVGMANLSGQELPDVAQGIQPYTGYHGGELDSVSTASGSLTVRIPLVSYPQKGTLALSYSVIFNSFGYEDAAYCDAPPDPSGPIDVIPLKNGCTNTIKLIPVGVYQTNLVGPRLIADQTLTAGGSSAPNPTISPQPPINGLFYVITADNATHPIGIASDGSYRSIDQSGYLFAPASAPSYSNGNLGRPEQAFSGDQTIVMSAAPGTITDSKGNVYTSTSITDKSGNSISIPSGAPSNVNGLPATDSTGRAIPQVGTGSTANCPSISGAPAATSASLWTPPGSGAGYLFCYAPVSIKTNFLLQHNGSNRDLTGTYTVLQSIVLPTTPATYWGFVYDSYVQGETLPTFGNLGQLIKLIYPTGGSVEYQYSYGFGPCDFARVSGLVDGSLITFLPYVSSRTEYDVNGNAIGTWSYTFPSGSPATGSIISPTGDLTVTKFVDSSTGAGCGWLDAGQSVYQGNPGSGGTPLRSTTITYNNYPVWTEPPYIGTDRQNTETTTFSGGNSSSVQNGYASGTSIGYLACNYQGNNCAFSGAVSIPIGAETSQSYTDYTGTALKQENTTYQWQNSSAYYNANLLDIPYQTQVMVGGTQQAATTYTYDESAYSPGGVHGLPTTTAHWLNTGSSPTTHTGWNSMGMKSFFIDANGNTNSNGHTIDYGYTNTAAGCNASVVTSTTNAKNQQTTGTYDCNTGLLLTYVDPNSAQTSFSYDSVRRLICAEYPDQGSTAFNINDSARTVNKVVRLQGGDACQSSSNNLNTQYQFDSFGRQIQTSLLSDPSGTIITQTTYDADGRVHSVTNPYRSTSDPTYGITSYTYDSLNRKVIETQPDGTTKQWCYDDYTGYGQSNCHGRLSSLKGEWVDYADEKGNVWEHTTNSLEQLISVVEPNGSSQTPSMETDYSYDALNDLISANQNGTGSGTRTRSFTYDSLSQLITSQNPETGTVCYGQLSGSTCTSGYDANGNLLHKTDARGVVTNYSFDSLNRLTAKTYSNAAQGMISSCFQFDTASQNGIGRLGSEWTQTNDACTSSSGSQSSRTIGAYDKMGRVLSEQQCALSYCTNGSGPASPPSTPTVNCATLSSASGLQYCYDFAGNPLAFSNGVTTQTAGSYPQQAILFSETFDGASRLANVNSSWNDTSHPASLLSNTKYSPANALSNWLLGSSLWTARQYDDRLRVCNQESSQQQNTAPACQ